jgi:integrase
MTSVAQEAAARAAWVDRIRPAKDRRELPDRGNGSVVGLYLLVQPSGRKSWAVRYRLHGKSHKFTLGNYPAIPLADARAQAGEALGLVYKGVNPATVLHAADVPDFETVVRDFIARHAKKNRSWIEAARLLGLRPDLAVIDGGLVERWGKRRIDDVTREEIVAMLDDIAARAPYVANRTLAYLRKFYNWALPRYRLADSPCKGVQPPGKERSRDRVLDDAELKRVWIAAGNLGWPFGDITRLLILTGQRLNEVACMEWSEVDLDAKLWTLPRGRVKNDKGHTVPLSQTAIEIIERLPRHQRLLFAGRNGKAPVRGFARPKAKLDELSGVTGWRLHDIRRTVASGMAGLKIALPVIEKVLNHSSGTFRGIVAVYQRHSFADEKRRALDVWAAFVEALVTDAPADNVVDMRRGAV